MSQRTHEKLNPRPSITSKQKVQDPKIMGLSPDDDIEVKADGTGKPAAPSK